MNRNTRLYRDATVCLTVMAVLAPVFAAVAQGRVLPPTFILGRNLVMGLAFTPLGITSGIVLAVAATVSAVMFLQSWNPGLPANR